MAAKVLAPNYQSVGRACAEQFGAAIDGHTGGAESLELFQTFGVPRAFWRSLRLASVKTFRLARCDAIAAIQPNPHHRRFESQLFGDPGAFVAEPIGVVNNRSRNRRKATAKNEDL